MPDVVEETDPEGVDYGWVMQTTFVLTIVVGAPVVALVAVVSDASIPTWSAQAAFAIRVGAVVWILTAVSVYLYARRTTVETDVGADTGTDADANGEADAGTDAEE